MSQAKLRAAIESRLQSWADDNTLRIAMEDVQFQPDPTETWARFTLLPAATDSPDLSGDIETLSGVAQVSICVPSGSGPGAAEQLMETLRAAFPVGGTLSADSFDVLVVSPVGAGPYLPDTVHSMLPVSFRYRADYFVPQT